MDTTEKIEESTQRLLASCKEFVIILSVNNERIPQEVSEALFKAFRKHQTASFDTLNILSTELATLVVSKTESALNATGDYEEEVEGELQ